MLQYLRPRAEDVRGSQPSSGLLRLPNGLNLVRLALVFLVVLSHSYTAGRFDQSPLWLGHTSGRWALAGLFTLSGFLIVSGRLNRVYVDYLARRIVRIWPLYAVCLLSIAALFGPIDFAFMHGTLDGYLSAPDGPISFLSMNILFELRQPVVSGTPDQFGWVGNLWTVFYTVLSYAVLGAVLGIRAAGPRLAAVTTLFVVAVVGTATRVLTEPYVHDGRVYALLWCLAFFAGGTLIALVQHRIRLHFGFAVLATVAAWTIVGFWPEWGLQAAAPLIGYALLTLGNLFRLPPLIARNDLSMGFFMFSVPVQQLMFHVGVAELAGGIGVFFLLSIAFTFPFAVAGWFLVERPTIRWARTAGATERSRQLERRLIPRG